MSTAPAETVLVTGASSGIGLELARCFAADKSNLVLVARNTAVMESLAEDLRREHKIEVHIITADLSNPESPQNIFEELKGGGIVVDVLVNNAGFGLHNAFVNLPLHRQLEMIQVNVGSLVALTGLFMPDMVQRKRGGILNVGSVAGFLPGPNMAVYFATKAFVLSFTEALAEELGGARLTISAFCPGATETNFSQIARGTKVHKSSTSKMSALQAARFGHKAFRNKQVVAVPGLQNRFLIFLTRIMPRWCIRKAVYSFNKS